MKRLPAGWLRRVAAQVMAGRVDNAGARRNREQPFLRKLKGAGSLK